MHRWIENAPRRSALRSFAWGSALFALGGVAMTFGCGPSVQSIYEGNVRFEHCYRLDLEVDAAPTHREACWKEWLSVYTFGQPRDRIEYARRRLHAFATGDLEGPKLDLGDTKRAEARQFYLVVPSPTSAHAPPAPMATRWYADAGTPATAASEVEPQPSAPEDECASACRAGYQSCTGSCAADAGKPEAGCKACDPDYKACMKRCFK